MLTISKRKMTVEDFIKNKKFNPYSTFRSNSKPTNFAQIFGGSGRSLGSRLRKDYGFKPDDCEKVIEALHLENALREHRNKVGHNYKETIRTERPYYDEAAVQTEFNLQTIYDIVGCAFAESFFESYKGLKSRINRENAYARKNGFVVSWRGVYRRLPELRYMKFGRAGGLCGADKFLWSMYENNCMNISANTDAQTIEAYFAFSTWARANYFFKINNLKTRIFNGTHDSMDWIEYEDEDRLAGAVTQKIASRDFKPATGIHMAIDVEESDLEKRQDEFYKCGIDQGRLDFDTEKKAFEEKHHVVLKVPEGFFDDDYYPGKELKNE